MKNFIQKGKFLANSLMWGLKSADKEILEQAAQSLDPEIQSERQVVQESVFDDLLRGEETQKVKETRDSMYRVFREADKLEVSVEINNLDKEDERDFFSDDVSITANVKKKDKSFFEKHPPVEEKDGEAIILIQDQKVFDNDTELRVKEMKGEKVRPGRLITVEYKDFKPRFLADDYFKRVVVKKYENKNIVDIYFNDNPAHFSYLDSLFIKNLYDKFKDFKYNFETLQFSSLSFTTNKAYGEEDLKYYKFSNPVLTSITHFNGSYVAHYEMDAEVYGEDNVKKYETKELTEKYAGKKPKSDTISLDLAERNMK